jgi:hypothetical protein
MASAFTGVGLGATNSGSSTVATPSTPGGGGGGGGGVDDKYSSSFGGLSTPISAMSPSQSQSYAQWSTPALAGWAQPVAGVSGFGADVPIGSGASGVSGASGGGAGYSGYSPFPKGSFAPVPPAAAGIRTQKIKHNVGLTTEHANRYVCTARYAIYFVDTFA